MEIKIVGAIPDENALEEIEDIAKIFAYEQHMKVYTKVIRPSYQPKKQTLINDSQLGDSLRSLHCTSSHVPVKGLC